MNGAWFGFAVALGLGLLIGIERERSKGQGPRRGPAGIRTFGLTALVGALAAHLGGPVLLAAAIAATGILTAISYAGSRDHDPGLTTEVALLAAPMLGALAMTDPLLASALGVGVAALLAAKGPVHRFVHGRLTDAEVKDGLVLALATVVIWPQLPDRPMGPYDALNPNTLWLLVVMMMAIGGVGHVLTRMLGPRFGLPLSGFASGFVSSTATIGSMAALANNDPGSLRAAVAGACLSTVATFVQMAALLAVVSRPTLYELMLPLAAGGLVAGGYGLAFTLSAIRSQGPADAPSRAFSARATFVIAASMAFMLVLAAALKDLLGDAGIALAAALAGLVDTHSAAVSVASLAASGGITPEHAAVPILLAMTTNSLSKTAVALGTGSGDYARLVIPGLALAMGAAWAAAMPWLM